MTSKTSRERRKFLKLSAATTTAGVVSLYSHPRSLFAATGGSDSTLRVKLEANLKELDPIWTSAYSTLSHAFLVYDTLFGMDADFNVQPQMVDTYDISSDSMTYEFTLRDGLKWHDGTPVTSEDCVASIKRWGARDSMGQQLMAATGELVVVDDKTFRLELEEPFGLVLEALGKLSSNVPFMMKKEHAMTDPHKQVTEVIGSGPFKFVKEKFRPGDRSFYVKNEDYVPRDEPPSNTAGGKIPKVDQVEIIWIPEPATAANSLISGELDFDQTPAPDLLPLLQQSDNVAVEVFDKLGKQGVLRLNWLWPPFDKKEARQAVLAAIDVNNALVAAVGKDPELSSACYSIYPCGSPLASEAGSDALKTQDIERAKELLKASGYDGEKTVVLHVSDDPVISAQTSMTQQALRDIGMNLDVQAMDWSTLVARRAVKKEPAEGGWAIFQTWVNGADYLNPLLNYASAANCEDAWFGWPCQEEIEALRTQFAREPDANKREKLAHDIQALALEEVTYVPLGLFYQPVAYRSNIKGLVPCPIPVFWNATKT